MDATETTGASQMPTRGSRRSVRSICPSQPSSGKCPSWHLRSVRRRFGTATRLDSVSLLVEIDRMAMVWGGGSLDVTRDRPDLDRVGSRAASFALFVTAVLAYLALIGFSIR